MEYLQISEENREDILEMFDKTTDKEGFIIDKRTKKRIKCQFSKEEINIKDNFSILPGSSIFIKNNDLSFARYLVKRG
jgi:hypothetical protein